MMALRWMDELVLLIDYLVKFCHVTLQFTHGIDQDDCFREKEQVLSKCHKLVVLRCCVGNRTYKSDDYKDPEDIL